MITAVTWTDPLGAPQHALWPQDYAADRGRHPWLPDVDPRTGSW